MSDFDPPRNNLASMLEIESSGAGASAVLESFWGEAAPSDLLARAVGAASVGSDLTLQSARADFAFVPPPGVPVDLSREDLTDSRVRIRAKYKGRFVADFALRFGAPGVGTGLSYQPLALDPSLPAPEQLPSESEVAEAEGWLPYAVGPLESRRIGGMGQVADDAPALWQGWLAPRELLPEDAEVHAAAVAFLSGYRPHWAVEMRLGPRFQGSQIRVVDHTLTVHRPERWTDFWHITTSSDVAVDGRCFCTREITTRAGLRVASASWELHVETEAPPAP